MLSMPGALLFGNLHIIFIISSGETGLQNILFLVVYEQYFSKSNCPQGCNDCPVLTRHVFPMGISVSFWVFPQPTWTGGHTHRPILTQNGSNDVGSCTDVPCGVKVETFSNP